MDPLESLEFLVYAFLLVASLAAMGLNLTAAFSSSVQVGGTVLSESTQVTGDAGLTTAPVTIPAAKAGSLTTRTDDDTGTLTMGAGHGIVTGQRVDLYWTGGKAWGVTVGTVSGTSVPIDRSTGGGDVLPAQSTAIKVGICTEVEVSFNGSKVQGMVLACGQSGNGYFVFNETTTDRSPLYVQAGKQFTWKNTDALANPLLAFTAITSIWMSHDDVNAAVTTQQGIFVTQST